MPDILIGATLNNRTCDHAHQIGRGTTARYPAKERPRSIHPTTMADTLSIITQRCTRYSYIPGTQYSIRLDSRRGSAQFCAIHTRYPNHVALRGYDVRQTFS